MRAKDFLERAERCLEDARRSQYDEYAVSIERASECIELSLKAAILSISERYPMEHDTSDDLLKFRDKFSGEFKENIPLFAFWSRITTTLYKYSKYGYEHADAPAKILFDVDDARVWVMHAERVLSMSRKYIEGQFDRK